MDEMNRVPPAGDRQLAEAGGRPPAASEVDVSEAVPDVASLVAARLNLAVQYTQRRIRHRLLLHLARIGLYRGYEATAAADPLDDVRKAQKASRQQDRIDLAAQDRAHLSDHLAHLVDHGVPYERRLPVAGVDHRMDRVGV